MGVIVFNCKTTDFLLTAPNFSYNPTDDQDLRVIMTSSLLIMSGLFLFVTISNILIFSLKWSAATIKYFSYLHYMYRYSI